MTKINPNYNTTVSRQYVIGLDENRYEILSSDGEHVLISHFYPDRDREEREKHKLMVPNTSEDEGLREVKRMDRSGFEHLIYSTYHTVPETHLEELLEKRRDLKQVGEALKPDTARAASD